MKQQNAVLAEKLESFKNKHLLDGVQPPVNVVLLFFEEVRYTEEWENFEAFLNMPWNGKHDAMFRCLEIELQAKSLVDFASLRSGESSLPLSARSRSPRDPELRLLHDRNDKKKTRNRRSRTRRSRDIDVQVSSFETSTEDIQTKISELRAQVAYLEELKSKHETSTHSPMTRKNSNRQLLAETSEEDKIIKSLPITANEDPVLLRNDSLKLPLSFSRPKIRGSRAKSSRNARYLLFVVYSVNRA